ncbi:MAG TPA: glucose-6-phosphate dehydrogenase, partial [Porticoccaceae bacterium]|nr:glucose-6-phosphate dehydrogenase [Porticoccaceae bacterium]
MAKNTDLIIFGAAGDLANRKLFPALYRLHCAELLEDNVRIMGLARADMSNAEFIQA